MQDFFHQQYHKLLFSIRICFFELFHSFLFKFHPSPLIIFRPTGFYSDSLRLPQIPQETQPTSQLYPFALQGLREMIAISLGQEIQCGTFPCVLPAKRSDWVEEGIGSPSGSKWGIGFLSCHFWKVARWDLFFSLVTSGWVGGAIFVTEKSWWLVMVSCILYCISL